MHRRTTFTVTRNLCLALGFALISAGCAFRTPTPEVPAGVGRLGAERGLEITEVRIEGPRVIAPVEALEVREEAAAILADAIRKSDRGAVLDRVRLDVELGDAADYADSAMSNDGMAVFGVAVIAPAGMKLDRQQLTVDLAFDRSGERWSGHGEADVEGSIYAPARKRALAVAIDRALKDAKRSR